MTIDLSRMRYTATLSVALCLVLAACATGTGKRQAGKRESEKQAAPEALVGESRPPVTLEVAEPSSLTELVYLMSEQCGGSVVLMSGIEHYAVGPVGYHNEPFASVIQAMADATNCVAQECPSYYFLHPPGYEALESVSLAGMLDPAYEKVTAPMTFGYDTPLFAVFALLSHALGLTIVGDNVVGDARCGTLTLASVPLQDGLDAVCKSARIQQGTFKVDSTPEYILISAQQNASPSDTLLNADALSGEQNAALDKQVDVVLPAAQEDPAHLTVPRGATPLGKVLDTLSEQLGAAVSAEPGVDELPVNPCVFNHVRVRTAMNLLIRQWPVADYGYRVEGGKIVIQRKR